MSEEGIATEPEKKFHPNFKGAITNEEARRRREAQELSKVSPEPEKESKKEVGIEETKKPGRKERIPFGTPRRRFNSPEGDGYHYRVFNDNWQKEPGRIIRALDAGYEKVEDFELLPVGTNDDGSPIKGVLMRIRKEFYEEDQDAKNKKLDETDAQILRGSVEGRVGHDGRYIPKEGIHYKP